MPTDVRLNYRVNWCIACPMHSRRDRSPAPFSTTCRIATISAGHVRAAVHARTDDQNRLPSGVLWRAGWIDRPDLIPGVRPADRHDAVSREGCGNIKAGTPVGTRTCGLTVRLHDSTGGTLERTKNAFRTSRLFTGRFVIRRYFPRQIVRTELRVDVFQCLESVNLGLPDRIVYGLCQCRKSAGDRGLITSADAARQAQLSVRLSF